MSDQEWREMVWAFSVCGIVALPLIPVFIYGIVLAIIVNRRRKKGTVN